MLRGEWFLWLGLGIVGLLIVRLVRGRPLLPRHARRLSRAEAMVVSVSLVLLIFHCAAMFAPDVVAALRILDRPAHVVRDLGNPRGQAAYWLPAAALVVGMRRLWWPAPLITTLGLVAVGWTMYGDFTLTQHLVTIVATAVTIAATLTGVVTGMTRGLSAPARPARQPR